MSESEGNERFAWGVYDVKAGRCVAGYLNRRKLYGSLGAARAQMTNEKKYHPRTEYEIHKFELVRVEE